MSFYTEAEPVRGAVFDAAPGIRRIVAPNPGGFTYWGTNTYLIEDEGGFAVLDPGPDSAPHLAAILKATDGKITRIIVSHTHPDHIDGLPALKAATGAPTYGYHTSATPAFTPDIGLDDNDIVAGWTALYTPGHASDHLCFARDGIVLTADHIMSWSTSIVSPPQGSMTQYFASLRRMLARDDTMYLPGHGPAVPDPAHYGNFLLTHRLQREAAIAAALATGPQTPAELVLALYVDLKPALRPAAERSVLAHLHKLRDDGAAHEQNGVWTAS
jgi:glyoxylase-like metal-dependent hydrolase (beta-lactamase superfamily II)